MVRATVIAADRDGIARAAAALRAGHPVAVPTETVYGLAARADRDESVAAIYAAKGRPDFNPLIVHVPNLAAAQDLAEFAPLALQLAEAFWPGPLTLALPLKRNAPIAPAVTAGLATIALRCPAHPVMQALLEEVQLPLAAPSANASGRTSPTRAEHVVASLGERVDLVVDGGECPAGLESTIIAVDGQSWRVLRPGPIDQATIAAVTGVAPSRSLSDRIEAPGQLASHYAPGKPLRLSVTAPADDEYMIGFGPVDGDENLSPASDPIEAASRLYAALHRASASRCRGIAVAPIPDHGIGTAINDRLRRAATPPD